MQNRLLILILEYKNKNKQPQINPSYVILKFSKGNSIDKTMFRLQFVEGTVINEKYTKILPLSKIPNYLCH